MADDQIGNIAQKAINVLDAVVYSDSDHEIIRHELESLNSELAAHIAMSAPFPNILRGFTESIQTVMEWFIERETNRNTVASIEHENSMEDPGRETDGHFSVSDGENDVVKEEVEEEASPLSRKKRTVEKPSRISQGRSQKVKIEYMDKTMIEYAPLKHSNDVAVDISQLSKRSIPEQIKEENDAGKVEESEFSNDEDSDELENSDEESAEKEEDVDSEGTNRTNNTSKKKGTKHKSPHECNQCDKTFRWLHSLKTHMNAHLEDDDPKKKKHDCKACGKIFSDPSSFYRHKRIHETDEEKKLPHKCSHCSRRFSQLGHLKLHKNSHLDESDPNKKKHGCDICRKFFANRSTLIKHKLLHEGNKRKYVCTICGNSCSSSSYLNRHKRIHEVDVKKKLPHECTHCFKRFRELGSLKEHINKHLAADDPHKKKYECTICGKFLCDRSTLKRHKRIHEENVEARLPFECDQCKRRFGRKITLKIHKQKIHCVRCTDNLEQPTSSKMSLSGGNNSNPSKRTRRSRTVNDENEGMEEKEKNSSDSEEDRGVWSDDDESDMDDDEMFIEDGPSTSK